MSQTAAAEVALAGEAELPFAFARLLAATVARIDAGALAAPGMICRFG